MLHVDDEVAALRIPDDTGMRRGRAERYRVRVVARHGSYYFEHIKRVRVQTPGGALELVGRPLVRVFVEVPSFIVHGQIQTGLPGPFFKSIRGRTPDAIAHGPPEGLGAVVFGALRIDLVPPLFEVVVDVAHPRRCL